MRQVKMYALWSHVSLSIVDGKLSSIRVHSYSREIHARLRATHDFCPYCGKKIMSKRGK